MSQSLLRSNLILDVSLLYLNHELFIISKAFSLILRINARRKHHKKQIVSYKKSIRSQCASSSAAEPFEE